MEKTIKDTTLAEAPQTVVKKQRTDEDRRKDREKKRAKRALRKLAEDQWLKNGGKPEEWDATWGAPTFSVKDLTKRLDERLHAEPIAEPLKLAIQETAEKHFNVNIDEIAKAAGISSKSVRRILGDDPARLSRLSLKREATAVDEIRMASMEMATQIREAISEGRVGPTDKNIDKIAIAFGIFIDKAMLLTGRATERLGYEDVMQGKSLTEQKQVMLNSMVETGKALRSISGGKQ